MHGNSFLMHGGKGEATPTLGWIMWGKEGGTQEREGPPGATLGWCIRGKGERKGKGQTEEVREKKGRGVGKNKEER
jgi:hypothetical protein